MAVAREMDQFFSFFARACNGVHGCKFDGLYDWDRSRLMGNPFSSVLSFDGRNLSARIIMRREIFRLLPFDENGFMEIILVLREKISSRTRQVNKYQFLFFFLFDYYYYFFFLSSNSRSTGHYLNLRFFNIFDWNWIRLNSCSKLYILWCIYNFLKWKIKKKVLPRVSVVTWDRERKRPAVARNRFFCAIFLSTFHDSARFHPRPSPRGLTGSSITSFCRNLFDQ